jgi:exodeoxyribonuclease V gamma subunit
VARRFKAGGVTFCTLLPLRAIPFQAVCLLGMNDGDYPRRGARSDFDLMALRGMARPGDRSRRNDDRQLMLDALLSARRLLYVSWAGRSVRDNEEQPPSVLVAQLRDYLAAGWGRAAVDRRTTRHPLQPFSRRYFEINKNITETEDASAAAEGDVFTYASEWRTAHEPGPAAVGASGTPTPGEWRAQDAPLSLDIDALAGFLRNPVRAFFHQRLQVRFDEQGAAAGDDEAFVVSGLSRWQLLDDLLRELGPMGRTGGRLAGASAAQRDDAIRAQIAHLRRAGRLPLAGPGRIVEQTLLGIASPMLAQWQALHRGHAEPADPLQLRWVHPDDPGLVLTGELSGLTHAAAAGPLPCWMALRPGTVADAKLRPRHHSMLLDAWVRSLAAAACGCELGGLIVAADAWLRFAPLDRGEATETLKALLTACRWGLKADSPTPTAVKTGLAWLQSPDKARTAFEGSGEHAPGEGQEPCLARLFPDFAALVAEPDFPDASALLYQPYRDWLDSALDIRPLPDAAGREDDDDDG